jgi:hypothetical protein
MKPDLVIAILKDTVNLDFHLFVRLGLWNKDYEALDPSYSVSSTASLLDFKLVLLTLFYSHMMSDETQMKRQQFFC